MKMVSQLTRQAMSRHRLLSAIPHPEPQFIPSSPIQTVFQHDANSAQPAPLGTSAQPLPPSQSAPQPPLAAASQTFPLRTPPQQTIYGQLMKKHDRFTERHLTRT